jgi:hypothetical protein
LRLMLYYMSSGGLARSGTIRSFWRLGLYDKENLQISWRNDARDGSQASESAHTREGSRQSAHTRESSSQNARTREGPRY